MSYKVIIDIIANGQRAVAEFDKAGKSAERMAKKTDDEVKKARISMEKFGRQAGIAGAAMIGAAGTVAFAMRSWVQSAQEAEMATMRLESSVKGAYGVSSNAVKAFEAQAKAIQKVTVASDEDVMSIQALLVQFGLTQRQVTTLTPLVVDISRKWGIDYVTASKAVAKAADGKTAALKKLGINVDETKAKTDPYIATVEALRRAAGGFAQQEGRTFAGQTAILANQMDELKESLGRGVLQVLNDVLPVVNSAAGGFNKLNDSTGGTIGAMTTVGTGILAVAGSAGLAINAVTKLKTTFTQAAAASKVAGMGLTAGAYTLAAAAGVAIGAALGGAINESLFHFAEKGAEGYEKALSGDTSKEIVRGFVDAAMSESGNVSNILSGIVRGSVRTVSNYLRGNNDLDNILGEITGAGFDKAFRKIAESSPQAARAILDYADAHPKLRRELQAAGADLEEYRRRMGDVRDINKDGNVTTKEVIDSLEAQSKAASELIDIVSNQDAVARSFAQATLGVGNAQRQLTEAQDAYNEAVKSGDPARIAEAQATLQGALLTLADAQDQARNAAFKHAEMLLALQETAGDKEQFEIAISKLEEMKAILTDPAEKEAIQERIDKLVLLRIAAGEEIDLNSGAMMEALWRLKASGAITEEQLKALQQKWSAGTLDTSGLDGALDALAGRLRGIKDLLTSLSGSGTGALGASNRQLIQYAMLRQANPNWSDARIWDWIANHRASGGPVAAGTPYIVGENGPEMFVPTGNGMIVPNTRLNGGGGSATMGGITVNVSSGILSTPAETGAAVVDALTAWSRRNGRLPAPLVA